MNMTALDRSYVFVLLFVAVDNTRVFDTENADRLPLHDFCTAFKAYRREILQDVHLYGDMHRFVPAICARLGANICEIPIKNARRPSGRSKYGIGRTFRVALDILMLRFISAYFTQPLHFFGKWGLISMAAGSIILGYGLVSKVLYWRPYHLFVVHGPLMAVGFLLVLVAMWLLSIGLIGEMLTRVYFESSNARTYGVARVVSKRRVHADTDEDRASKR